MIPNLTETAKRLNIEGDALRFSSFSDPQLPTDTQRTTSKFLRNKNGPKPLNLARFNVIFHACGT